MENRLTTFVFHDKKWYVSGKEFPNKPTLCNERMACFTNQPCWCAIEMESYEKKYEAYVAQLVPVREQDWDALHEMAYSLERTDIDSEKWQPLPDTIYEADVEGEIDTQWFDKTGEELVGYISFMVDESKTKYEYRLTEKKESQPLMVESTNADCNNMIITMKESKEPEQKWDRTIILGPSKDNPPFKDEMISKQIAIINSKSMENNIFELMREAGKSYGELTGNPTLAWSAFEAGGVWMHSKLKGQADRIASLEAEVKQWKETVDGQRPILSQQYAEILSLQAEVERLKKVIDQTLHKF